MQLAAVIIPPPDVVEDALVVARGLVAAAPEMVPRQQRPGLLGRLLGRSDEEEPASIGLFEPERSKVFVRLVKLGHVSDDDATSLTGALRGLAVEWDAPVLHVSSVSIEDGGPPPVRAHLGGDVDALRSMVGHLDEAAAQHGLTHKRRSLRHEFSLGALDVPWRSAAGGSFAATREHRGRDWQPTHITLVKADQTRRGTVYVEVARLPLATAPY
jgi:2'-5' RNA ligase